MKANPALANSGRKQRVSTLPGTGISHAEKVRRIAPLRHLNAVLTAETEVKHDPESLGGMISIQSQLYRFAGMDEFSMVRDARKHLDKLSTPTLLRLSATYADTKGLPPLSELVCDVQNGSEWKKLFPRRVEGAMIDFLSYRDHLGRKLISNAAQTFSLVYKLTGKTPGSLANLTGESRESVAALLLVVSEDGHFTGDISGQTFSNQTIIIDDYSSILFPKEKKPDEFPAEFVENVMANPDLASTLVEFMNTNLLTANKVNWDDFLTYADTTASLRDGVL